LSARRVRFTTTAQRHVESERRWWVENRTYTEVFASELEEAVRILAFLPGVGTPYPRAGVVGLRRIYLRKVACHVYYTFDENDVIA
jgi:plasmid stabilization system protein ParE